MRQMSVIGARGRDFGLHPVVQGEFLLFVSDIVSSVLCLKTRCLFSLSLWVFFLSWFYSSRSRDLNLTYSTRRK